MSKTRFTQPQADRLRRALELIRRAKKLHRWARDPVPLVGGGRFNPEAWRASHLLRFMLWVGRTGHRVDESVSGSTLFFIGPHNVKMSVDIWIARERVAITPQGLAMGEEDYKGAIIVCPPGHGKTQMFCFFWALEICHDPANQVILGHAKEDRSLANLQYIASCFDRESENGSRCMALFPTVELDDTNNRQDQLRVRVKGRTLRQNTMEAYGVKAAISGADATGIGLDDPVDQAEADSETERKKKYDRIIGTWLNRMRGDRSFELTITTLWHEDDANCRRIRAAHDHKEPILVSIQGCGGPDENFEPLCEELWNRKALRAAYHRQPHLYACAFQSNPTSTVRRPITMVRFFDARSEEHRSLLATATSHLSIDPAATSHAKSDEAGLVYAAEGEVRWIRTDEDGRRYSHSERRVRVLGAIQIRANQAELGRAVEEFTDHHRVDEFHVETRSGFQATADILEAHHGITAIRHDPMQKSKLERLKMVAGLIDDSGREYNGPRAVVEFPGVYNESGELVCDPDYQWLVDQFLKFGSIKADHCVDALVQLVKHLDLRAGSGPDSREVGGEVKMLDPRVSAMLDEHLRTVRGEKRRGAERDLEYLIKHGDR